MRTRPAAVTLFIAGTLELSPATRASAHRLDEYLQATILSVEKDRVHAQLRLAPGVSVAPFVLAGIDRDGDGALSEAELRSYADRVRRDLSLTVDSDPVELRLVSFTAGTVAEMRDGRGDMRFEIEAAVPSGGGTRRLRFENRHQGRIAAYLVNCLVPSDPAIRIVAQRRNDDQSVYELDYAQPTGRSISSLPRRSVWVAGWLVAAAALLAARIALPRLPAGPRRAGFSFRNEDVRDG